MAGWPRAAARSASASGKAAASRKLNALLACSSTNIYSVIDGVEAPASAIAGEPAERAVVELHVPLVLDEGRFRPPLARHAPRPRARDDPPREPGGAEMNWRSSVDPHLHGSRRSHAANGEKGTTPHPALSPEGRVKLNPS